jgi:hypothetical protein|tara:strand:- start:1156 stop:1257 length:102 start_codon:yes stop_codon:yes gene_type:complete
MALEYVQDWKLVVFTSLTERGRGRERHGSQVGY